jgi:hypothetical protein
MSCNRCGFDGEFIEENYGTNKILFCPNCYTSELSWCKHENNSIIKYSLDGKFRIQNMCNDCFKLHGSYFKHADYDLSKLKEIKKINTTYSMKIIL